MNKVILLGRLTKDCNTKYTQTGKCVTTFTLAVNRPTTKDGEQQADFVPVVLWGKVAETVGNYVHKGQRLLVEGRLQVRTFEANDGSKRWVTEVIGSHIEFIEKKEDFGGPGGNEYTGAPFAEEIPF